MPPSEKDRSTSARLGELKAGDVINVRGVVMRVDQDDLAPEVCFGRVDGLNDPQVAWVPLENVIGLDGDAARSSAAQSERWLAVCRHCSLRVDIPLSRHEPCSNGALHDWMRVKDEARSASASREEAVVEASESGFDAGRREAAEIIRRHLVDLLRDVKFHTDGGCDHYWTSDCLKAIEASGTVALRALAQLDVTAARPTSPTVSLGPSPETLIKALLIRVIGPQGPAGSQVFTGAELRRAEQQELDVRNDGHTYAMSVRWNT